MENLTATLVEQKLNSRSVWYGTTDEIYLHQGIVHSVGNDPPWCSFS